MKSQRKWCLKSIKQNFMSNMKIEELIPQSTTEDIFKKVSLKENFYQDQITGKLEVIGLHWHYLKQAVGETLEPYHFIWYPKDKQKLTKEDYEKGEQLYHLLVQAAIIQGDRRRKAFQNCKERSEMEENIRNNLDPSIVDPFIMSLVYSLIICKSVLSVGLHARAVKSC